MPIQRPTWLPSYLPELQGLRGLAILAVVLYHCHPRLEGTWIYYASLWGWAGVIVFFASSGFLITSILLERGTSRTTSHNFHARRALRIWPVYVLVLVVVYLNAPWFIGPGIWEAIKTAPWLAYIFFVQNLFHLTLPPAIGPTWALAIEEQYYFLWAPAGALPAPALDAGRPSGRGADRLRRCCAMRHSRWLTPTHTLIHLDGIALGSLLALGLYTLTLSRRVWLVDRPGRIVAGLLRLRPPSPAERLFSIPRWPWALPGRCWRPSPRPARATRSTPSLRRGPLAFYGRISYGLYMTHIMVFIYFGWFDLRMDRYGIAGNLAVVAFRLAASTARPRRSGTASSRRFSS